MTIITPQALEAGARAYAADTYRGTRDLNGAPTTWDTLTDTDRAACLHKARIVLQAAHTTPPQKENTTP